MYIGAYMDKSTKVQRCGGVVSNFYGCIYVHWYKGVEVCLNVVMPVWIRIINIWVPVDAP